MGFSVFPSSEGRVRFVVMHRGRLEKEYWNAMQKHHLIKECYEEKDEVDM
jgi:hypothetical protein